MDQVQSPLEFVTNAAPEHPVAVARPHRVSAAAAWFVERFPGHVFYAVKANPSPWALDALWAGGVRGFDVASEAEAKLVAERFPEARLAFMHPVKSRRAIRNAYHKYGVRIFALDSVDELEKILAETDGAKDLTLIVRMTVSNDSASYPLAQKFGATAAEAPELLRRVRQATEEIMGVSFHVGSQCMRPLAYKTAMMEVNRAIIAAGVVVDVVDIGGGFPAIYPEMNPAPMQAYMDEIAQGFEGMYVAQNAQLWSEPGRALVAEAGSIVARVELRKSDALYLNDGGYGNLFDAAHVNWKFPVKLLRGKASRAKLAPFRFYGPTCDSLDTAVGPFMLPADIREGDYIEIGMLGAYSTSIATNFNGFGETITIEAKDAPWPTLFVQAGEAAQTAAPPANTVNLEARRKTRRPRK